MRMVLITIAVKQDRIRVFFILVTFVIGAYSNRMIIGVAIFLIIFIKYGNKSKKTTCNEKCTFRKKIIKFIKKEFRNFKKT